MADIEVEEVKSKEHFPTIEQNIFNKNVFHFFPLFHVAAPPG